jgi:predicted secreted protein
MNPVSAIAIYFIIWWTVLFAVLPFGVRNASESGEIVDAGNDPGSPQNPQIAKKCAVTTLIAAVIFVVFYILKTRGLIGIV